MKLINLLGQKFGKLTVMEFAGTTFGNSKKHRGRWKCECTCGNITIVDSSNLRRGKVIGCGKCRSNIGNQHGRYDLRIHDSSFMEYFRNTKQSAKNRGLIFNLTEQDVRIISGSVCTYCGNPPNNTQRVRNKFGKSYIHNGIDRVDNEVGYILENCVPCCEWCNKMKLAHNVEDFMEHINKIHNYQISK